MQTTTDTKFNAFSLSISAVTELFLTFTVLILLELTYINLTGAAFSDTPYIIAALAIITKASINYRLASPSSLSTMQQALYLKAQRGKFAQTAKRCIAVTWIVFSVAMHFDLLITI